MQITTPYLSTFPHFSPLKETLTAHTAFTSAKGYTVVADGNAYWELTTPSLPQPVIRRAKATEVGGEGFTGSEGEVFFDVNELAKDGGGTASQNWGAWSSNGRYWATMISRGG